MAVSAQGGYTNATGMKRKKTRYAPIIQEQAKQGLATKMVAAGKQRAQDKAEWEFTKSAREQELANQRRAFDLQREQAEWQKTRDWINIGIGAVSTGVELVGALGDWF